MGASLEVGTSSNLRVTGAAAWQFPKRKKAPDTTTPTERPLRRGVRRHNMAVGQLIWHWDRLHSIFTEAFATIITPDDRRAGLACLINRNFSHAIATIPPLLGQGSRVDSHHDRETGTRI